VKKQLIDTEVPAEEMLAERAQTNERNDRGTDLTDATFNRRRRTVAEQ
jgi:hypothetical protein